MRAFVALDLPEPLLDAVTRLQAGLTAGRPVPEENLHLTLAFLGEITQQQAYDVAEGLATLVADSVPLTLRGVDLPQGKQPNLIWIGADPVAELVSLQDKIARIARDAGITLERRRFRPHVTLARFGKTLTQKDERTIGEFLQLNALTNLGTETADYVTLYRSQLHSDGSVYIPLAEAELTR